MQQSIRQFATRFMVILGFVVVAATQAQAQSQVLVASLSGAAENPPVNSPGTGTTTITINPTAHTLRVQTAFSGLTTGTTASHIHCCATPPTNAGVATMTPSFVGFPLGVTQGSMDQTYNTLDPATYNAPFLAANGGTPATAEAALFAGIAAGRAYLNIHTTQFGGGEIRGFLALAPGGVPVPTLTEGLLGVLAAMLLAGGFIAWRSRRA